MQVRDDLLKVAYPKKEIVPEKIERLQQKCLTCHFK